MGQVYEVPYPANYDTADGVYQYGLRLFTVKYSGFPDLDYIVAFTASRSGVFAAGFPYSESGNDGIKVVLASSAQFISCTSNIWSDGTHDGISSLSSNSDIDEVGEPVRASRHAISLVGGGYPPYVPESNTWVIEPYASQEAAFAALRAAVPGSEITYRGTNCTLSGPSSALSGAIVTVNCTFPAGYGLVNPDDAYVTNNGVVVPSTFSGNILTFTMP